VQWMMTSFLPVALDPPYIHYDRATEVFREFIRFWHKHHGFDWGATLSALAVIKRHEQEYAELRHDPVIVRQRASLPKD